MSLFFDLTTRQLNDWNEWVKTKPENLRNALEKIKPYGFYKLKKSNKIIVLRPDFTIKEKNNEITCSVIVPRFLQIDEFVTVNHLLTNVDIKDLTETELPKVNISDLVEFNTWVGNNLPHDEI